MSDLGNEATAMTATTTTDGPGRAGRWAAKAEGDGDRRVRAASSS